MHFVAVLEIDRIAGTICIRTEIKFPTFICLELIEAKTNLLTDKKTCSKHLSPTTRGKRLKSPFGCGHNFVSTI